MAVVGEIVLQEKAGTDDSVHDERLIIDQADRVGDGDVRPRFFTSSVRFFIIFLLLSALSTAITRDPCGADMRYPLRPTRLTLRGIT